MRVNTVLRRRWQALPWRFVGVLTLWPTLAFAQQLRGVVVDQTGLPLPGAHIEIHRGTELLASVDTDLEGAFEVPPAQPADDVVVSLDGFETAHPGTELQRVVLVVARATETTEVVASALTSAGAAMEHLGSTMSAPLAQRLPTPRPRILQSLPLLPAVVRGRDGLLNIGGTRPHESSLWIDGFDVTDPVSGTTAIDLPVESVRGMAVLREPVSATFSNILGSAASVETTPGGDQLRAGVQGFIPRPRLSSLGFGTIDSFFPRAYVSGRVGMARYFASTEFNFERVPVPGVTGQSGRPNIGTTGVTSFGRFDLQPSTRQMLTIEALFSPGETTSGGLSTTRPPGTTPDIEVRDLFGGITERLVVSSRDVLTVRAGVLDHITRLTAQGTGEALLTPTGWQQNWFSTVDVTGRRESLSATWERAGVVASGAHVFSVEADAQRRTLDGSIAEQPLNILDGTGRLLRRIEFGPPKGLSTSDAYGGVGVRDLWDVNKRLQVDLGVRFDAGSASEGHAIGPRAGFRFFLDAGERTTVRGSVGRYAGRMPLGARTLSQLPSRTDMTFDPDTGAVVRTLQYDLALGSVQVPRSDAAALQIEHRLTSQLELQAAVRVRRGTRLPTVTVPENGGLALLASTGESEYREWQVSARRTWVNDSQVFVSYVESSARGDSNDYGSLFTNLDTPLLEPNVRSPTAADVPHRLRAWGTFSLPRRVVLSPSIEWRSGFPFSAVTAYQHYAETPNNERFPAYFATDVTAFKTFDIAGRRMNLGLQLFNVTAHFNPRDVFAVVDSPLYGQFAGSFGVTVAGYMQILWQ
jgi:hypothetical protein